MTSCETYIKLLFLREWEDGLNVIFQHSLGKCSKSLKEEWTGMSILSTHRLIFEYTSLNLYATDYLNFLNHKQSRIFGSLGT